MHQKQFYKNLSEKEIEKLIRAEDFEPYLISDEAGTAYHKHKHEGIKLLAIIEGDIEVVVDKKRYLCRAGDKLIIPGNTEHSAVAGRKGCTYFWSEKSV